MPFHLPKRPRKFNLGNKRKHTWVLHTDLAEAMAPCMIGNFTARILFGILAAAHASTACQSMRYGCGSDSEPIVRDDSEMCSPCRLHYMEKSKRTPFRVNRTEGLSTSRLRPIRDTITSIGGVNRSSPFATFVGKEL